MAIKVACLPMAADEALCRAKAAGCNCVKACRDGWKKPTVPQATT